MGKIKKKFESGAATNYISRNQALKKLQLSLKDFRRLCILKGIHPHEPLHKKKVNKGGTENKTWYYVKDIFFLHHEPIIQKFRDYKIFLRKLKKATAKKETDVAARVRENKPLFKLDHIVRERYPTFVDSLRDLDDALSMCFLFARLPKSPKIKSEVVQLCRRLTVEFLHYVISSKSLRKVFVSIKGIYYQAEILGQTITWVLPHDRGYQHVTEVDYVIMATFVDFYTAMLGFVNFRLFKSIGLFYPPQLASVDAKDDIESASERISNLGEVLRRNCDLNDELSLDEFPDDEEESEITLNLAQKREKVLRLQKLFCGSKFFLNREVPRESLTFVIRSCGGEVSWDSSNASGSTYQSNDQTITHHIIDRPADTKTEFNRSYLQPQWVLIV